MGRLRSTILNGLLLLAGLVGALLVAEGLAGLLWKAPWHERLLGEQTAAQRHPVKRNGLGLRGAEIEVPRPSHLRRVLVIGDSFTFGLGVRSDRAPFPALLDERLRPRSVQVVNGGIPGSLTGDWGALWRRAGAAIDPQVVVAVFFLRDGTRLETIPHFFAEIREGVSERNQASWLYRSSRLYRWIRDLQTREWIAQTYTDALSEAYLGPPNRTEEWRRAQRNLLELRDMVEEHGAVFGLAFFPVLVELEGDHPFQPIHELLVRFARDNGIPAHDLLGAATRPTCGCRPSTSTPTRRGIGSRRTRSSPSSRSCSAVVDRDGVLGAVALAQAGLALERRGDLLARDHAAAALVLLEHVGSEHVAAPVPHAPLRVDPDAHAGVTPARRSGGT